MSGGANFPVSVTALWKRLRMRAFHIYFLFTRPMTLGVRALVLDRTNNTVLLVKHTYVDGWHLPGGGVDSGETMRSALLRELIEEAKVEAMGEPELISLHHNNNVSRRDHVALYLVEAFRQTGPFSPNREIADARFFSLDELPRDTSNATARRIAEVLNGTPPSQTW